MYNGEASLALAEPGSGVTVLNLNGEINLFGSCTNIYTTDVVTYPVINDEPIQISKQPETYGGLTVNEIVGCTATFILGAVAICAIPGAAVTAIICAGAAIGTAAVTAGEYNQRMVTGQSSSMFEFGTKLAMGGMMGAMAGASTVMMAQTIPVAAAAATQQAVMVGASGTIAATIETTLLVGGSGLTCVYGAFGISNTIEFGSGVNPMLEQAFKGDRESYEAANLIIDLLSMGTTVYACDNVALAGLREASRGEFIKRGLFVATESSLNKLKLDNRGGVGELVVVVRL